MRYKTVKVRVPVSRLPLRSFGQTARQVRGFESTANQSYKNFVKTRVKVKARVASIQRTGFTRKSIYQKSAPQIAIDKVKKLRQRLGGGLYG